MSIVDKPKAPRVENSKVKNVKQVPETGLRVDKRWKKKQKEMGATKKGEWASERGLGQELVEQRRKRGGTFCSVFRCKRGGGRTGARKGEKGDGDTMYRAVTGGN